MIESLKSVEWSLMDFGQCFTRLGEALTELQQMARTADFGDSSDVAQFKANVEFIKRYYEKLGGFVCGT